MLNAEDRNRIQGCVLLDKPPRLTSRQCVTAVQKLFPGHKAGHAGTLDPFATGLLPVCIGRATKLVDYLRQGRKQYTAALYLGIGTDTQDYTGTIVERCTVDAGLTLDRVQSACSSFLGRIEQVPPMYSSVKHNGKRLYKLARQNIEVERKPRNIRIYDIRVQEYACPEIRFSVVCSEGTYIRTLGVDIAQKLGTTGMLTALRRLQVGNFRVDQAVTLDELLGSAENQNLHRWVLPSEKITAHLPSRTISRAGSVKFKNGVTMNESDFIDWKPCNQQFFNVFTESGRFLGLAETGNRVSENISVLKTARLIDIW